MFFICSAFNGFLTVALASATDLCKYFKDFSAISLSSPLFTYVSRVFLISRCMIGALCMLVCLWHVFLLHER